MSKPQTTAPAAPEKKIEAPAPQTEEKPEAPAIDLSGVEVGTTVKHKKFGEGTIESFTKDHKLFRVKFQIGEKAFQFPQAFENGFLSI